MSSLRDLGEMLMSGTPHALSSIGGRRVKLAHFGIPSDYHIPSTKP